jgi:enoyl-CoA hydratase
MHLQNFETIQCTVQNHVATITINRPQVLNALSTQVIRELRSCVEQIANLNIRAVVVSGAGEKAFVAGADISEMMNFDASSALEFARQGQALTMAIEALKVPTIARVQGFALGGGCELAMACDIIIASKKAKFGQPEVNLGLIPGFGGTQRLVRRVGLSVAMDMLTAGRNLTGEEAYHLGLVSRVCEPEELDSTVQMVIKGILKAGPVAVAETKRVTRLADSMDLPAGLAAEATAFAAGFGGAEAKEGTKAFVEKRPASFSL